MNDTAFDILVWAGKLFMALLLLMVVLMIIPFAVIIRTLEICINQLIIPLTQVRVRRTATEHID